MTILRRSLLALILCAVAGMAVPAQAQTQAWPQRNVRFIIPLGPGSGVDITARLLADKLSERWGQSVVVENRPGGDAIVAINSVLGAKDDHILLFAPASTFTAHPLLHESLPYKIDDLVPIARVTNTLIGVAVPTSLTVSSLKDFVAKLRAEPGKLNYASATGANDLLFTAFLKSEKLDMAKVPYKNTVEAVNDLAEGRVQGYIAAYAILRPHVQAGKVKVIALTNSQHAASLNDIPTAAEAGFKSLEFDGLVGLLGPKGMPDAARQRIAKDIREIVADPAVASKLAATGQVVNPGSPEEFTQALREQRETVSQIGKTLGIKAAQ